MLWPMATKTGYERHAPIISNHISISLTTNFSLAIIDATCIRQSTGFNANHDKGHLCLLLLHPSIRLEALWL